MARIRTIKPEFWTDEKVVQLPYAARLLFIGLWNFCDDDGYLMDEPDRIKMQILPADTEDVGVLLDRLAIAGLVERVFLDDYSSALRIPSFPEHQKISHKAESKIAPKVRGKVSIPLAVRRELAVKYGCNPGESCDAECYYCGAAGSIHWQQLNSGRPGSWVCFSRLSIDHFVAEAAGGATNVENMVLACSHCNKSKGTRPAFSVFIQSVPESTGGLSPDRNRNGIEGNGIYGRQSDDKGDQKFEVTEEQIPLVRSRANKVTATIGRKAVSKQDRSLVAKAAILSLHSPFTEQWLFGAAEGVKHSEGKKERPFGYLHTCLEEGATKLGKVFNQCLARVNLPDALLRPPPPEDSLTDRLCNNAPL